ncbi:NifB/NifX family molybdenum-iron cluster-binding protein [Pseudodesulfovibrio piezophilus]|uniref:Dinitrogenase iron-molybdenum cofactor biosynthesis domain-containing protein n=1 Tax=Pseudodesulfovibrio piezophilus (strain DSM 21447 / JCM 15486 / C1TLV30) TaxID=1322246 RepID=M1WKQ4_PSEP2|nr:hypothetical protein [Pseudodesulfovibrio piezophilus]CCH50006.1 conserved protein of unknown function [Pseudodesulfovibrio piezophilus C1TLV30]
MKTSSATLLCLACYQDRLASVCENADEYKLFEIRNDKIYPAGLLSLPSKDPMDRTSAILACGVLFFVCGAICSTTLTRLEENGVIVVPWLTGHIDEVLMRFAENSLFALVMPGCIDTVGRQCGEKWGASAAREDPSQETQRKWGGYFSPLGSVI